MRPIYGIDLGTTYTKCAVVRPTDRAVQVFDLDRDRIRNVPVTTLRSAVTLTVTPDGRPLAHVGSCALEVFRRWDPKSGIPMHRFEETKAWIGEELPDSRRGSWHVEAHAWRYRPEDVAALVLRKVKKEVEGAAGPEMSRVLVTHPQLFTDTRRKATRQAVELAGLTLVETLTEPDAAAVAYAATRDAGTYMVFDVGGGTLDVTVFQVGASGIAVVSSAGNKIGGREFDRLIFGRMVDDYQVAYADFKAEYLDAQTAQDWMRKAEQMKQRLNDPEQEIAREPIRCANELFEHGRERGFVMRRDDFIASTQALVADCVACAGEALGKQHLAWSEIDQILCVGGTSRLLHLRAALEQVSGRPLRQDIDPDTVVAQGAALRAAQLASEPAHLHVSGQLSVATPLAAAGRELRGVLARGVGVLAHDRRKQRDIVFPIVPGNTSLPHRHRHTFRTAHENQTAITVELYEGDHDDPDFCEHLGKVVLDGCPPGPSGQAVEVELAIDTDGTKHVLVESAQRRREAIIAFDPERVLPEAELAHRRAFLDEVVLCDCGRSR